MHSYIPPNNCRQSDYRYLSHQYRKVSYMIHAASYVMDSTHIYTYAHTIITIGK